MRIETLLKTIKGEWEGLKPAARYSTIYGSIFLFVLFINRQFELSIFPQFPKSVIYLTISFIFIPFPFIILERFYVNMKMVCYKTKYPLKNLNKTFYLIDFSGFVYLLDNKKKELRWIKSLQTAADLDFLCEWTSVSKNIRSPSILKECEVVTKDGKKLRLKNFKYVDGIHTQGRPGA